MTTDFPNFQITSITYLNVTPCIYTMVNRLHQWWSPPVGGGLVLRAGIEITVNLPGHPMSVTQCYLAINDTRVIRVVYSFA